MSIFYSFWSLKGLDYLPAVLVAANLIGCCQRAINAEHVGKVFGAGLAP
jgi:hypothetical protein